MEEPREAGSWLPPSPPMETMGPTPLDHREAGSWPPPSPPLETVGPAASSASLRGMESLSSMSSVLRSNHWGNQSLRRSSSSVMIMSCWSGVLGYVSKLLSLGAWFTALMCFVFANFVLPIVCGFQMLLLDYVLCYETFQLLHWVWLFVFCELGLLAHLMRHRAEMHAVGSGSFQWIVYSWLISTKSCVLYFHVLPDLDEPRRFDLRAIVTILWLTPVFYTILTFRTLRELFQSDSMKQIRTEMKYTKNNDVVRDKEEHTTLDVVLLTDMVWHVVIDMIDIFYMMFLSNPFDHKHSIVDPMLLTERPETVKNIRMLSGVFIFLGLFFHQQSFPSIGYMASSPGPLASQSTSSSKWGSRQSDGGLERLDTSASEPRRPRKSADSTTSGLGGQQPMLDYRVDVVKARKRSAIVSILMVDLPFLVIRTYMYLLSMNTAAAQATTTTTPLDASAVPGMSSIESPFASFIGQDRLDKFWVKNILCMLLQAMQLRFVQQADLERSQSLRWWDMRRSTADGPSFGARRRRADQDRCLRRKWAELDRGKLEAAMQDTGGFSEEEPERPAPAPEHSAGARAEAPSDVRPLGGHRAEAAAGVSEDGLVAQSRPSACGGTDSQRSSRSARTGSRRSRRCGRCCRRRVGCRCCSCDCSSGIVAHILMGMFLGWLIAKVDFNQAATDLMLGLGRQD